MDLICSVRVQEAREDDLLWEENRRRRFSVKLYYIFLCAKTKVVFLAKELWGLEFL